MLVREVQRLTSEVEDLRGRVDAYERSRWMRLHPGLAVRRLLEQPRWTERAPAPADVARVRETAADDPLIVRFRDKVVSRGAFTHEWFLHQIRPWEPLFAELEERGGARLLEIGAFEGLSACYALWRLPDARITCVDTFAGSVEYVVEEVDLATLEDVFRANVALVDASRVETLVGDSRQVLVDLVREGRRFDLAFVDGSHLALDVLADAALSWQLLAPGGFLVFDDYEWKAVGEDPLLRPGPAIDAFLSLVSGKHELLRRDVQLALRKTG